MIKNGLKRHDFENGGPEQVLEWLNGTAGHYILGGDAISVDWGVDNGFIGYNTTSTFTVTNTTGDNVFNVIGGENNIVLGTGITVPEDATNTTYVNNLNVGGSLTYEPREGEVMFNTEEHQLMAYVNGEWVNI